MPLRSRRGSRQAGTLEIVVPVPARVPPRRFEDRGLALVALLVVALSSGAAPAHAREAGLVTTAAGVTVSLLGADPRCLHRAGDGIFVTIGDHRIVVSPGLVRFDGVSFRLTGLRRVVVDATGWGLTVTANDEQVAKIDPLAGLEAAAAAGNTLALNDLAVRLANGDGIARDIDRAARLYRQAAAGLPLAARNLASLEATRGDPIAAAAVAISVASPQPSEGEKP